MAQCVVRTNKKKRVCIGALNRRIEVKVRTLTATADDDVDYTEVFTALKTVWAMVETVSGKTMFDSSNVERIVTHNFYIRFISGVTSESWVKYKDQYFDILNVENLNEEDTFYKLVCAIRGDTTKPVNSQ